MDQIFNKVIFKFWCKESLEDRGKEYLVKCISPVASKEILTWKVYSVTPKNLCKLDSGSAFAINYSDYSDPVSSWVILGKSWAHYQNFLS